MKIRRTSLLSLLSAACLALGAQIAQAAPQPPDQAARATTEKMRALIAQNHAQYKADPAKFYKVVDQVLVPRFDVPYISQIVLGREWRNASDAQRKRFQSAFKNSLVHSYASALLDYHDQIQEEWQPLKLAPGAKEAMVNVSILRKDAPPLAIGFSMHLVGQEWKVYDVSVEGISLASNFRAQFGAEIKKNGLDALIKRLEGGGKPLAAKN